MRDSSSTPGFEFVRDDRKKLKVQKGPYSTIDYIKIIFWTIFSIWFGLGGFVVVFPALLGLAALLGSALFIIVGFILSQIWVFLVFGFVGLLIYLIFKSRRSGKGFRLLGIRAFHELDRNKLQKREPKAKPKKEGLSFFDKILFFIGIGQFLGFWGGKAIILIAFIYAWIAITFRWKPAELPILRGDQELPKIRPVFVLLPAVFILPMIIYALPIPWLVKIGLHIFAMFIHAVYGWYIYDFNQYGKKK